MKIAAIEIIENASGDVFAYDVNVNTNYNADAEKRAGASGMGAVARYLGAELARQTEGALEAVLCIVLTASLLGLSRPPKSKIPPFSIRGKSDPLFLVYTK